MDPGRRTVLGTLVVGAGAVVLASLAGVAGTLRGRESDAAGLGSSGGSPTPAPSTPAPGTTPAPSGGATSPAPLPTPAAPGGPVIGKLADFKKHGAIDFTDPTSGDPGVLVKLSDGKIVAFDAVCTHAGCTVGFDSPSGLLLCPCHGAAFDPSQGAAAVAGPTNQPLTPLPITIDQATGQISLNG